MEKGTSSIYTISCFLWFSFQPSFWVFIRWEWCWWWKDKAKDSTKKGETCNRGINMKSLATLSEPQWSMLSSRWSKVTFWAPHVGGHQRPFERVTKDDDCHPIFFGHVVNWQVGSDWKKTSIFNSKPYIYSYFTSPIFYTPPGFPWNKVWGSGSVSHPLPHPLRLP